MELGSSPTLQQKTLINKMRMERGDHISLLKRHGLRIHAFEVVLLLC